MADPTIELAVPSHPKFLKLVRDVMRNAAKSLGITGDRADGIILAVDEACSNIIRHSYMGRVDKTIEFSITLGKAALTIAISDSGKKWNPPAKDLNKESLNKLKPGGLGLLIIRRVMDRIDFSRANSGKNIIRMVKYL
ncbi:MAG: ATP-binding protein [Desulfobacter sp.]|nr:MAG: ATP-binding protein [Desulfobacter sp.]